MIKQHNFSIFLESTYICYSEECQNKLPNITDFPDKIFDNNQLNLSKFEELANETDNIYLISVINRILGIILIQKSRESGFDLETNKAWYFIAKSIRIIPSKDTISSIGSQGFLSIPLYKFNEKMENFEFLRLHIWDDSLKKYIDQNASNNFSIHTHSFHAHSWIITGKIINDRYIVTDSLKATGFVRFTINYNKSLNQINQHTSTASNDNMNVNVKQISHEVYMSGGSYQIKPAHYHNSGTEEEDGLSATFFSFTAKNGIVEKSFVVGPSEIEKSKINRKMHIDPNYLLDKIENKQF